MIWLSKRILKATKLPDQENLVSKLNWARESNDVMKQ